MKRSLLWLLMLLLTGLLPTSFLSAAEDEPKSAKETEAAKTEEKAKQIVAVFRLKGGLSETPTDESFPFGGQQSTALLNAPEAPDVPADLPRHQI